MERANKHLQQELEYNVQTRKITAQIAHRAKLAVRVALKKAKNQKAAAKKAKIQLKNAHEQALAQSRTMATAHSAELAKLKKVHAMKLSVLHQKLVRLRKRSRQAVKQQQLRAEALQVKLKSNNKRLSQAVQEEHSHRIQLMNKLQKQRAKSARIAQASVIAARSQAVKSTELQITGMKKELAKREKELRAKEKLKVTAAESVERHTEAAAAEELLKMKTKARVEKAKLITQYTGVVPTYLGEEASAAGKLLQQRQKKLLKAMNDPKAAQIKLAYMGCFSDRAADHDVAHLMPVETNVPARCAAMCRVGHHSWKYAALQNGKQCFCGTSYGRHGKEPKTSCFKKCQGSPNMACGGVMRNSVYSIDETN